MDQEKRETARSLPTDWMQGGSLLLDVINFTFGLARFFDPSLYCSFPLLFPFFYIYVRTFWLPSLLSFFPMEFRPANQEKRKFILKE